MRRRSLHGAGFEMRYRQLNDDRWIARCARLVPAPVAATLERWPSTVKRAYVRVVTGAKPADPHPELRDPDWLSARSHLSSEKISSELGCRPTSVRRAFAQAGIEGGRYDYPELHDLGWLRANRHRSHGALAERLVCPVLEVTMAYRAAGIPPVPAPQQRPPTPVLPVPDVLHDDAWLTANAGRDAQEVADALGVPAHVVRRAYRIHGFDRPGQEPKPAPGGAQAAQAPRARREPRAPREPREPR